MAGNVGEWVRDAYSNVEDLEHSLDGCTDCLRLEGDDAPGPRILRGGNIVSPASEIRTYIRFPLTDPSDHYPVAGVRCAYDE
jgi:formylglycine-generating enzyme required for sulfatase activity